jgi:hypothetical protein
VKKSFNIQQPFCTASPNTMKTNQAASPNTMKTNQAATPNTMKPTKLMHLSSSSSSSRDFQRNQEHDLKHPAWVDLISTKQNKTKQTTLLHT